jgi:hypothetical protein
MRVVENILFNAIGELLGKLVEFTTKKDRSSANKRRLISVTHPNSVDAQLDFLTAELLIVSRVRGSACLPIPQDYRFVRILGDKVIFPPDVEWISSYLQRAFDGLDLVID